MLQSPSARSSWGNFYRDCQTVRDESLWIFRSIRVGVVFCIRPSEALHENRHARRRKWKSDVATFDDCSFLLMNSRERLAPGIITLRSNSQEETGKTVPSSTAVLSLRNIAMLIKVSISCVDWSILHFVIQSTILLSFSALSFSYLLSVLSLSLSLH